MHIVCYHLFNDLSGSPKMLGLILRELLCKGYHIDLYTSSGEGSLSQLKENRNIKFFTYTYSYSARKVVFIQYLLIQVYCFFGTFRYLFKRDVTFYINTILPFGAALGAWIMGKRIVYHCHENLDKSPFYRFLGLVMKLTATEIICVSEYQARGIQRASLHVIPNAVSKEFSEAFKSCDSSKQWGFKTVLMLTSLKLYKGIAQFFQLANGMPNVNFILVVNSRREKIECFLKEYRLRVPINVRIFESSSDVVGFYKKSSLLVNLTLPEFFIETFGMTVLEGMTAGLPVVVPPVGGVAELIEDGVSGYKVDPLDINLIKDRIAHMLSSREIYSKFSDEAHRISAKYSWMALVKNIENIIKGS